MGLKYVPVPEEKNKVVLARKRFVAAQLLGVAGRVRHLRFSRNQRGVKVPRAAHAEMRAILSKLADGIEAEAAKLTTI